VCETTSYFIIVLHAFYVQFGIFAFIFSLFSFSSGNAVLLVVLCRNQVNRCKEKLKRSKLQKVC